MDFTPTEEQAAARELAARIFGDLSTHERLSAAGTDSDPELWKALCAAGLVTAVEDIGLLGLVLLLEEQGRTTAQVPFAASCVYGLLAVSAHGSPEQRERLLPGIGDGSVVVCGAVSGAEGVRVSGRAVAEGVPASGESGVEGVPASGGRGAEAAAGVRSGQPGGEDGLLSGVAPVVPWLRDATHVLVADDRQRLWLVRTADAVCEPVELTAPWAAGRLTLDGTPGELLGDGVGERLGEAGADADVGASASASASARAGAGTGAGAGGAETRPGADAEVSTSTGTGTGASAGAGADGAGASPGAGAYADVLAMARTAFAGLQAGVCAGSLARAVQHTNTREQFGRPLAARQGVQLRAADAYMDTEAIRVTTYEAAWRRDAGLPFASHALTAAWWASEAGHRVVHTGQHLHGGTGADVEHPVHRHFLWGRQLDAYLGCGSEVLQELGELIAHGEGDE
ncbi:acyl-CoA dehydrogenase family protein [Streptomyces sp. NPDC058274]|uniref:acyl-CoA dehydrogenase family protein n=1 Tax=Streptomyces sp. NPDC058274 TaxID=3346416 RepID=UPI0036F07CA2